MKRILTFLLIFGLTISLVRLPYKYSKQIKSALADPTITAMTLSRTNVFITGTSAAASQVNTNFSEDLTEINRIITDLTTFSTGLATIADNETISGIWTFTPATTFTAGITFGSGATAGITNTFAIIDADNTGAGVNCSLRFQRGTDNANDAQIVWNASPTDANTYYSFTTDGTTLSNVRALTSVNAADLTRRDEVCLLTTAQTVAGVKTFSSYPVVGTTYAAPTTDLQVAVKKYVDDQTSSISTGGITQQASQPAVTNNTLWIDNTSSANYKFFRANGTRYDPVTGIHQGTSAPTTPSAASGHLWIDTTSTTNPQFKRYDGTNWQVVGTLSPFWGDGSDGACSYTDGMTSTLTMDANCTTLTITGSGTIVNPAGYRIFARTCTLGTNAKIQRNGNNGTNGAANSGGTGGAGGAGATALAAGSLPGALVGADGGAGGTAGGSSCMNGSAGASAIVIGSAGAAGGAGNAGCGATGGAAGTATTSGFRLRDLYSALAFFDPINNGLIYSRTPAGGGGGGGNGASEGGSGGGGGGGNGGNILLACRDISVSGTFTIEAIGGNGGNGGAASGNGNGGGGGGAGSGGTIVEIYNTLSGTISTAVTAGTAGTAGTGVQNGSAGAAGSAGTVITIAGN